MDKSEKVKDKLICLDQIWIRSRRIDEKTTDFTGGYGKVMSEKRIFYSAAWKFQN